MGVDLRSPWKGLENMKEQTIAEVRQKLSSTFDQVSAPLYFESEGPFFMAIREQVDDVKFFVYEANDVETFLADPAHIPSAFKYPTFMINQVNGLDLTAFKSTDRVFEINMMRLVPDSAACRLAIQQLNGVNPDHVLNIALLDAEGKIIPAVNVVDNPVLLM